MGRLDGRDKKSDGDLTGGFSLLFMLHLKKTQ